MQPPPDAPRPPERFATTAWSTVLRAATPGDPEARPALSELCKRYWYPLYAFARRRGTSPAEAEDLVQSFFGHLLEKNILQYADPARGRFRGFLAAAFRQFTAARHAHETAAKRSPASNLLSIHAGEGEERYSHEPVDDVTPERLFEHAWALAVVSRAMERLRGEQHAAGRGARFDALQGTLSGQSTLSAQELGKRLSISEGAVRVAVHRLRERYGELLREEVAETLEQGEDVEDELRNLLSALRIRRTP